MRHISFIAFIVLMACHVNMVSQPCLPDGITFTSQSQIDSFPINYPNCDTIEGFVIIDGIDIYNLNGLNSLHAIEGSLRIGSHLNLANPMLYDLQGLENLCFVGGWLNIVNNQSLQTLDGLDNIMIVNGYCVIDENQSLTNIDGLSNLTTVGEILGITHNDLLVNLMGLSSLTMCGGLVITHNQTIENLHGLESLETIDKYHLIIWHNDNLLNLSGLDNLAAIGTELQIQNNPSLQSITGIDNISYETIEYLDIRFNPDLTDCDIQSICEYIADPQGTLWISGNDTGCNSVNEVEEACTVGTLEQQSESLISTYPNPFTTSTAIEFALIGNSKIQISIFNAIGEEVYQFEETYDQGTHNVSWSPSHLPGGLYFAVLRTEEGVSVVKMVKQ